MFSKAICRDLPPWAISAQPINFAHHIQSPVPLYPNVIYRHHSPPNQFTPLRPDPSPPSWCRFFSKILTISCPRGFFHLIKNHKSISLTTPFSVNPVIPNHQSIARVGRSAVLIHGRPEPSQVQSLLMPRMGHTGEHDFRTLIGTCFTILKSEYMM